MPASIHRFTKRLTADFFHTAQRRQNRYFRVFLGSSAESKLLIIVPKKTVKLATGRNTLRRRVRAAITPLFSPTQSRELVVVPFSGATALTVAEIQSELKNLLEKQ